MWAVQSIGPFPLPFQTPSPSIYLPLHPNPLSLNRHVIPSDTDVSVGDTMPYGGGSLEELLEAPTLELDASAL